MTDYSKLAKEQARVMGMSPVHVVEEDSGNASTDGSKIYVNPSFMSKVESSAGEGGVRFILGHELGHIHHGMSGGHAAELEADQFGARSVAALNFDSKAITGVMTHLGSTESSTHPASGTRETRALEAFRRASLGEDKDKHEVERRIPRFPRPR